MRESSREAKLFPWIESLFRDTRFGARILLKERSVTAAAVLSLSLAIGACTAAFSLLNALISASIARAASGPANRVDVSSDERAPGAPLDDDHFSYPTLGLLQQAAAQKVDLFAMTVWGRSNLRFSTARLRALLPRSSAPSRSRAMV